MKNVTTVTKDPRIVALVLAAAICLSATTSHAADSNEQAYDNVTIVAPISANSAKRLVRGFLAERGFVSGIGPGAARIRSISRDGSSWVVQIAYSLSGATMTNRATLYVNADSASVSEVAPEKEPVQVAAQ
jgi:hypothetical protein